MPKIRDLGINAIPEKRGPAAGESCAPTYSPAFQECYWTAPWWTPFTWILTCAPSCGAKTSPPIAFVTCAPSCGAKTSQTLAFLTPTCGPSCVKTEPDEPFQPGLPPEVIELIKRHLRERLAYYEQLLSTPSKSSAKAARRKKPKK